MTSPTTSPQEPIKQHLAPRPLVAGYVLDPVTSLRLVLRIRGINPDSIPPPTPAQRAKKPRSVFTYDLLYPEPGSQPIPNIDVIRRSLRKYMAGKSEDLVDVWYADRGETIMAIIITQGCLLTEPHQLNGPLPVATEGEQEKLVREWLKRKGFDESQYTWEVHDDPRVGEE